MRLPIYPLILGVCFGTALTAALPKQTPNPGQNSQNGFDLYNNIPQDKWPTFKGQLVDPQCILRNLGKKHQKREWPSIPQPVYPMPGGSCPAWQQNTETETETDREDRELCGDGFEPRCCVGKAFGFGLGTIRQPCYQYLTSVQCKNVHKGETYCCEKFTAFALDGTVGFNCRSVTFVSLPSFQASSSSSPLIDIPFADANQIPSILPSSSSLSSSSYDASSSDQELHNPAAADWASDTTSGNYINIAASNADLPGFGDSAVANPFWVE